MTGWGYHSVEGDLYLSSVSRCEPHLQNTFTETFRWVFGWIGEGNGTPLQYSCLENPMDGAAWRAAVQRVAEGQTRLSDFIFTFHCHALEKEMATHSSVLAWSIPGTAEPGGLPSMGSHRVGHDWSDLALVESLETVLAELTQKTDHQYLSSFFHLKNPNICTIVTEFAVCLDLQCKAFSVGSKIGEAYWCCLYMTESF